MRAGSEETSGFWESAESSVKRVAAFERHSSGSKKLDALLGGGYRAGTLTEVFGRSNSGKSQLAMQAVLEAARREEPSLYVDTEGSFRPERLEQMAEARGWEIGGLMERVIYVRTDSVSEQLETVRNMQARPATASSRLVVVDTLTRNFSVELPGTSNLSNRQAALGVHISEMARDAYINGRAYILTNRVTFGPSRDVSIGGRTVEQLVHASVMLERDGAMTKATLLSSGEGARMEVGAAGVT